MKKNSFNGELLAIAKEVSYNKKSMASFALAAIAALGSVLVNLNQPSISNTSAATDQTENMTFEVGVDDSLSVSLSTPESGATGNPNTFLRNQVDLEVTSNASNGFTASMYSSDENSGSTKTNLTHTSLGDSYSISTLSSSSTKSDFPTNSWGYSLKSASMDGKTYGETDAGNNSSTYYPLTDSSTSPIKLLAASAGTKSGSQSIYFGAKANSDKPSGTYKNTVVISVVTGTIDTDANPTTPTNPVNPTTDIPNDNVATYTGETGTGATQGVGTSGTTGTTVYTTSTTRTNSTTGVVSNVTTTEVSGGDNRSTYTNPHGAFSATGNDKMTTFASTNTQESSALPMGLAVTAGVSAAAGALFFILAKKSDDDDEEQDEFYE